MMQTLYTSYSGLISSQKGLDVESNNIANVSTTGFKSDTISFADMMYTKEGVGYGATSMSINKDFSQGNIKQTDSSYDFTIKGDGFFTVSNPLNPVEQLYTRAGDFRVGAEGYLETNDQFRVLGISPMVGGDKITSDYTKHLYSGTTQNDNTISSTNIYATNYNATAVATGTTGTNSKSVSTNLEDIEALKLAYNLASNALNQNPLLGTAVTAKQDTVELGTTVDGDGKFDIELNIDGIKYTQSFDTSVEKTLNLFSDKLSSVTGLTSSVDTATGLLTIDTVVPGNSFSLYSAKVNDTAVTKTVVSKAAGAGEPLVSAIYDKLKSNIELMGGKVATNTSTIDKNQEVFTDMQFSLDTMKMNDDALGTLQVEGNNIFMLQGEGKYLVGRIEPVKFINNQGLNPQGDNLYSKTVESGEPIVPKTEVSILNKALENSNADLANGLVNLMVFQRAFEANSKSITTSDEFLKTAINLKK